MMNIDDDSSKGLDPDAPTLPAHIERTVEAIMRLHSEHRARATPLQRFVETLTASAGRPSFIALLTALVLGWLALNLGMKLFGHQAFDEPPFVWLQGVIALSALYMTVLILTTQRREDELTVYREQLTLELAILSEQKTAKIIALLEELRRDTPLVHDRHDAEAETLSTPSDPDIVLDAIKGTQGAASGRGLL